jgi:hypothetical protein
MATDPTDAAIDAWLASLARPRPTTIEGHVAAALGEPTPETRGFLMRVRARFLCRFAPERLGRLYR